MRLAFSFPKSLPGGRCSALALLLFLSTSTTPAATLPGYIPQIPPELESAREQRHAKVADRRKGPVLIAHRGASTLATENTLEAYAAAMDYGADGCEIDIRRSADGVLVLFHDDMLDHLTDGFGKVEEITCADLLTLHPQVVIGTATSRTRPPTFAALLALARQRVMLLHLDVKETGLEDQIAQMLEEADVWDHIVALNTETAPKLLHDRRVKLLPYKGGLYEARRDVDPDAVTQMLAKPGQCLILEDPRLAANQLNRKPYLPVPLPRELEFAWRVPTPPVSSADSTNLVAANYLRRIQSSLKSPTIDDLASLLGTDDVKARKQPSSNPEAERRRTERLLERAWAAERLGQIARPSSRIADLLIFQVNHPTLHSDWIFNALDAHTAARALGRLHITEAAPALIAAFRRIDPALASVRNPQYTNYPLSWVDWRKAYILPVLGELRTEATKRFLLEYVDLSEAAAREIAIPNFEEATKSLLRHDLSRAELTALLGNPKSAVRGTAILQCLDYPSTVRTACLREVAPWALSLPSARAR